MKITHSVLRKLFIQPLHCLNVYFHSNTDGLPSGKIKIISEPISETTKPGKYCRASTAVTSRMHGNKVLKRIATFFGMTALTRGGGFEEVIGIQTLLKACANRLRGHAYHNNNNRDISGCTLSPKTYYRLLRALASNCISNARRSGHADFLSNCTIIAAPSSSLAPSDFRDVVARKLGQPAIAGAMVKITVAEAKKILRSKAGKSCMRHPNKIRASAKMVALVKQHWEEVKLPVDGYNRINSLKTKEEAYYARVLSWACQKTSASQKLEEARTMFSPRRLCFWTYKNGKGRMKEDRQVDPYARGALTLPGSRLSAKMIAVIKDKVAKDGYINILCCEDDLVSGGTQNDICRIIQKAAGEKANIIFFVCTDARAITTIENTKVLDEIPRMNGLRLRCLALKPGEEFTIHYPKDAVPICQFLGQIRFKYKHPVDYCYGDRANEFDVYHQK